MKYIINTEFIDTPTCSALISLAIVRHDGEYRYFEFSYPEKEATPWLRENVVPLLSQVSKWTLPQAAISARRFIANDHRPEFWCWFGAYDWYWFCRMFGGMMFLPPQWPQRFREFAELLADIEPIYPQHHALNNSRAILQAMRRLGMNP